MTPPAPLTPRWLRTVQAAAYAGFESRHGFVAWAESVPLVPVRRGRCLLWDRFDIDREFELAKLRGYPVVASAA